jgi:hypothetical protein
MNYLDFWMIPGFPKVLKFNIPDRTLRFKVTKFAYLKIARKSTFMNTPMARYLPDCLLPGSLPMPKPIK